MVEFKYFRAFAKKVESFGSIESFDVLAETKFRFRVRVLDLTMLDIFPSDSHFSIEKRFDCFFITFDISVEKIKKLNL